jgi:hypothetical protein
MGLELAQAVIARRGVVERVICPMVSTGQRGERSSDKPAWVDKAGGGAAMRPSPTDSSGGIIMKLIEIDFVRSNLGFHIRMNTLPSNEIGDFLMSEGLALCGFSYLTKAVGSAYELRQAWLVIERMLFRNGIRYTVYENLNRLFEYENVCSYEGGVWN